MITLQSIQSSTVKILQICILFVAKRPRFVGILPVIFESTSILQMPLHTQSCLKIIWLNFWYQNSHMFDTEKLGAWRLWIGTSTFKSNQTIIMAVIKHQLIVFRQTAIVNYKDHTFLKNDCLTTMTIIQGSLATIWVN